jgi:hypothetical protein
LPEPGPKVEEVVWFQVRCQCGRPVLFWPDQHVNTCGWCKTLVIRQR